MSELRRRVRVKQERGVITYSYLKMASFNALEQAKQIETGRFYNLMTSMLFCAFTLEAFLNHVGMETIDCWSILKKKLSPEEKLDFIANSIKYEPDFGVRPFQSFKEILKFRNTLVHAETEYIETETIEKLILGEVPKYPETEWERKVDLKVAQRFFDDTLEIIKVISPLSGIEQHSLGWHGWQITEE